MIVHLKSSKNRIWKKKKLSTIIGGDFKLGSLSEFTQNLPHTSREKK